MFTTDKAICEMTQTELDQEYRYCIEAADTEDKELQRYFYDRAAVIRRHMDERRVFDN